MISRKSRTHEHIRSYQAAPYSYKPPNNKEVAFLQNDNQNVPRTPCMYNASSILMGHFYQWSSLISKTKSVPERY
jgi:hypothetical protein